MQAAIVKRRNSTNPVNYEQSFNGLGKGKYLNLNYKLPEKGRELYCKCGVKFGTIHELNIHKACEHN